MTTLRESEGPDRCRTSVKCRQFHDLIGTDLGGDSNCCCCNPCLHVRQDVHDINEMVSWAWCCRCVPRIVYLRYTAENDEYTECCRDILVPMFHNRPFGTGPTDPADPLWSVYVGTLFGYRVVLKCGRVGSLSGYGDYDLEACGWKVEVEYESQRIIDQIFLFGHNDEYDIDVSCIKAPEITLLTDVAGFPGCTGVFSLQNFTKARLPFEEAPDAREFRDNLISEEYDDPAIVSLTEPCGECTEVCSRLCVRGPRHSADSTTPYEFVTFTWFEEDGFRGWRYGNPKTGLTEYLYLEDEATLAILVDGVRWYRDYSPHSFGDDEYPYWHGYLDDDGTAEDAYIYWTAGDSCWALMIGGNEIALGPNTPATPVGTFTEQGVITPRTWVVTEAEGYPDSECRIRPRFEALEENEVHSPVAINTEDGCGSQLFLQMPEHSQIESRTLEIRCGFCSCWRHHCGLCRCVPDQLCTIVYDGSGVTPAFTNNLSLHWNSVIGGWGDEYDPVRLLLQRDEQGRCIIVPDIDGYTPSEGVVYPLFDCGEESWDRIFDPETDFLSVYFTDWEQNVFVTARSGMVDCSANPCQEGQATPCGNECGGHPQTLYADFTMYPNSDGGGAPPRPPYTLPTVTLTFISTVATITPGIDGGIFFDCGYIGFIPSRTNGATTCCAYKVYLSGNSLTVEPVNAQYSCVDWVSLSFDLSVPSGGYSGIECDPYYAEGQDSSGQILHQHCLHPEYDGTLGETGGSKVVIAE